jgi:23S rRNA-/tRNA-specific pseudouridylate synthase
VHLQAVGHPIVGDTRYGGGGARLGSSAAPPVPARVAARLVHPTTGVPVHAEAPLPPDLVDALAHARTHQRP